MTRISEAIASNLPTIRQAEQTIGTGGIMAIITEKLLEISEMVNVGKQLTQQQAVFAAQMTVERFSDLRPDDVAIFAKKFVCGDYGAFFDKLDVQTIIEALKKFDIERTNEIIAMQEAENKRRKQLEQIISTQPLSPERMKQLEELRQSFGKPQAKHPDFGKRPVVPPPTK